MSFQQALSGLNASSSALDAIGNNIANASTVGFKQASAQFTDAYAAALGGGSGAGQVGMGTNLATVAQQFSQGSITADNNPLDIAINGGGFFQLIGPSGKTYTRDGQFQLDQNGYIVNSSGLQLTDINSSAIKATNGQLPSVVTSKLGVGVNLDARQSVPVTATFSPNDPTSFNQSTSATVYDSLGVPHTVGMYFVKTATTNTWNVYTNVDGGTAYGKNLFGPTGLAFNSSGILTTSASVSNNGLADLFGTSPATTTKDAAIGSTAPNPSSIGATNDQFGISLDGGTTVTQINVGSPIADVNTLVSTINSKFAAATPPVAATASLDAAGNLMVSSTASPTQTVTLSPGATNNGLAAMFGTPTQGSVVAVSGTAQTYPLVVTAGTNDQFTLSVNGSSPVTVTIPPASYATAAALATQLQTSINALSPSPDVTVKGVDTGTTGALTVTSSVLTGTNPTLALTSAYNSLGSSPTVQLNLPLSSSASATGPLSVTLSLAGSTQFGSSFGVNSLTQDGSAAGQFTGVKVLSDGKVQATYDNGLTKDLGTIAVCTFQDPNALIPVGDSQWQENKSTIGGSGQAQINSPGASGSGILQPSATEGSNVDLTAQLVDMITQQRNYQANAQTIKTMDSIMQTLINLR